MIYLYHGEDSFLSYYEAKKRFSSYENESVQVVLNVDEITTIGEFSQHTENIGLFETQKVIFAKRVFNNKLIVEYIANSFDTLESSCEVIIWEDKKIAPNRSLLKKINLKNHNYFKQAKLADIQSWLREEIKARKLTEIPNLTQILISSVGENKWLLYNELTKLSLAKDTTTFNPSNVQEYISKIDSFDIWTFLYNLSKSRLDLVYKELDVILIDNDVQYLISMIRRQLFILSLVFKSHTDVESLKLLRIHPFAFQKAKSLSRNFTWEDIKKLSQKLLSLDLSIKQGEIDAKLGLTLFLQLF